MHDHIDVVRGRYILRHPGDATRGRLYLCRVKTVSLTEFARACEFPRISVTRHLLPSPMLGIAFFWGVFVDRPRAMTSCECCRKERPPRLAWVGYKPSYSRS